MVQMKLFIDGNSIPMALDITPGNTNEHIIDTLRNYILKKFNDLSYSPLYERTDLLDKLHDKIVFDTSYEIIEKKKIILICFRIIFYKYYFLPVIP